MTDASLPGQLAAALRDALTPDAVALAPGDSVDVDGLKPAVAVTPRTQQEMALALAAVAPLGAAVIPRGGGTQMALGMPPERYDAVLDLTRLDRLVEYEPADLTVTVEAGMRLAELQARLGERGQWLPLDPPLPDAATVGGVLATNASGPARLAHGTARDLLIGITFATPEGKLIRSGGRVVKNVAGYDLGKLQIGALGTLGVIAQATFKVAPLPAAQAVLAFAGDLPIVMSTVRLALKVGLALKGLVLQANGDSSWTLLARIAGGAAAVERSCRDFLAAASALRRLPEDEALRRWHAVLAPAEGAVIVRAGVLPGRAAAICEALQAAGARVMALPASGTVRGAWLEADAVSAEKLTALRALAERQGQGALVVERAPVGLKLAAGVWGAPRADFALMQALKRQFDPDRVLNPGRFLGGL